MTEKHYAIVTGASSGLGRCLALELAGRGIDTILVSLPGSGLGRTVEESRNKGINCIGYETDLSDLGQLSGFCEEVNSRYSVSMLINNAGIGGTKNFTSCKADYLDRIISINVRATTLLTHGLLPNLMKASKAYILNVSSMAAFSPVGFKTIYPASKCFIHNFTQSLNEELRGTGVFVSAVYPGPMKTNTDVTRRIERQGIFGHIGLLKPETVARISINGLLRHKSMILPGWTNKINRLMMEIVPARIRLRLISRVVSRELGMQDRRNQGSRDCLESES